jgi:hypothetical protein
MYIEGRNFALHVGRSLVLGPRTFEVALAWNDIELLTGRPVEEFHRKAADWIVVSWQWPRFRGFHYWSSHVHWASLAGGSKNEPR